MSTPTPNTLPVLLDRFRREADKQNAVVLRQLGNAYNQLYRRLSEKIELEGRRIFEQGGETISRQWIRSRLSSLRAEIEGEVQKYSAFVELSIDANTDDMLAMGSRHAQEVMKLATFGRKGLNAVDFRHLSTAQIDTIIGFLSKGSPLRDRIAGMAGFYTDRVVNELIDAVALGYGPYKSAGNIAPFLTKVMDTAANGMASVFAAAVRLTRTSQIWAYREATRANYRANDDVVTGWQWSASLDADTCASCWSQHGTVHDLDEPLDDHYHGRCYPTPVVLGQPLIPESSGQERFNNLSEAEQRQILGDRAFEAYQGGQFEFSALSKQVDDDVYGTMRVVPSLSELIGE